MSSHRHNWSNVILCSRILLWEDAVALIADSDPASLCPELCRGEVCAGSVRTGICLGAGGEGKYLEVSIWFSAAPSRCHPGPGWASAFHTGLFLTSSWDTLSGISHSCGDRYRVPCQGHHTGVYGSLDSPVMWMSVFVTCVYKYKLLFLFDVTDYSRFLKSVFFHMTLLPCFLIPCVPMLPPIKERTSICKAVDTIREACCHGFWRPVTIVVVVFCIAWYHESVNTVMLNLFIKTDYWTRAQKPQVTLYVNLFCEEGKPGQATNSCLEWSGTLATPSLQFSC